MKTSDLILLFSSLVGSVAAQGPLLVNVSGSALPLSATQPVLDPWGYAHALFESPTANVFMGCTHDPNDPNSGLPNGYYLVTVYSPIPNALNQVSTLPETDRIFEFTKNPTGGYNVSRLSATPGLPAMGAGPNGGTSAPLFPFDTALQVAGRPDWDCVYKVILSSPTQPGPYPFFYFRIGNGQPGVVSGVVFNDSATTGTVGVRDPGEAGVPGVWIDLVSESSTVMASQQTGPDGSFSFTNLGIDRCHVSIRSNPQAYTATTPVDVQVTACGCGLAEVIFGVTVNSTTCFGRTPGFWRNNNGIGIIQQGSFWDELAALNLKDGSGNDFNPTGQTSAWRSYMQNANATNMAYMLSVHLAAMQLNVLSGNVSLQCWVSTPGVPNTPAMTINALMTMANAALAADGYTPVGDPNRALQEALKSALDAANNNLNWL